MQSQFEVVFATGGLSSVLRQPRSQLTSTQECTALVSSRRERVLIASLSVSAFVGLFWTGRVSCIRVLAYKCTPAFCVDTLVASFFIGSCPDRHVPFRVSGIRAGINVRKGTISDMYAEHVIQPVLVNSSALKLATECVGMILKIDDVVAVM